VMSRFIQKIEKNGGWETILEGLTKRETDPYSLAEKMMAEELKEQ